jgi:hypothetical protein
MALLHKPGKLIKIPIRTILWPEDGMNGGFAHELPHVEPDDYVMYISTDDSDAPYVYHKVLYRGVVGLISVYAEEEWYEVNSIAPVTCVSVDCKGIFHPYCKEV